MSALNRYQDPYSLVSDFLPEDLDKESSLRRILEMRDELKATEHEFRSKYGNVSFSKLNKKLILTHESELDDAIRLLGWI